MQMLNLAHIKGPSDISEKDIDDESRALRLKIGEIPTEYPLIQSRVNIAVKVWNRAAEINLEISYKLVEQLMAYYNDWKANLNIKQKLSLTFENQKVVHDFIRNPQCSLQITATPLQPMQLHKVTSGL